MQNCPKSAVGCVLGCEDAPGVLPAPSDGAVACAVSAGDPDPLHAVALSSAPRGEAQHTDGVHERMCDDWDIHKPALALGQLHV